MRATLSVVVVLILGGVAWLLNDREPAATPVPVPAPAAAGVDDLPSLDLAPSTTRAPVTLSDSLAPSPATAPAPDLQAVEDQRVSAAGRFRLLLPDGSADESLDGEVTFVVWHSDSPTSSTGTPRSLPVSAGRFRLDVLAGDLLQVAALSLAGASAVPLEPDRQLPTDRGPLVIEVRHVPTLEIHVTDAVSGAHLDGIELSVQPLKLFGVAALGRPGARGELLISGASSPLRLTPPTAVAGRGWVTLDVRAHDHADGQLGLDPAAGGSHHVALAAGASLEVFVEGADPPDGAVLRLRRRTPDGPPTRELPLGSDRPLLVDGLVPGLYHAQVDLGDWHDQPSVLASASALLVAGRTNRVVLTLDPDLLPRLVGLSGSLVLPAYWRPRNDALQVERVGQRGLFGGGRQLPLADMQRVAGRDDLYLWDAGEVLSGRYELSVPAPHTAVLLDVGSDGLRDALLEVPPPGRLSVELVDALSGAALSDALLAWSPANAPGIGGLSEHLARDADSGLYELVAPIGEVRLAPVASGVALEWTTATVHAGGGRTTLTARRQHDVVVLLDDGDQLLPVPGGLFALAFEPLDGSGQRVAFGQRDGVEFITLDQPGRYRVQVPAPVGFAEIPPQEIDVQGPGTTRHVIRLLR